jgi:hypothetical protein
MTMQTEVGGRPAQARAAEAPTHARRAVANIAVQLAALRAMSVSELHSEYRRLFGEPSHSRNKSYLRKKVAWGIQEAAEGGLSTPARDRIEALLGSSTSVRFRTRDGRAGEPAALAAPAAAKKPRDARLPKPGTVLRKEHGGAIHEVTVLSDGFEYRAQRFTSLSKIANAISGSTWNGYAFFGLPVGSGAGTKGKRKKGA